MSSIERAAATQGAVPDAPTVWILSTGELHEGGHIIGVYLDRALAQGDFATQARQIHDAFGVDSILPEPDGALQLIGGCDWLSLEPHTVKTMSELDS